MVEDSSPISTGPIGGTIEQPQPQPRILADLHQLVDDPTVPSGARWRLAEPGRQLDANLIHLPSGHRVDTHTESALDVVLLVVAGSGSVGTPAQAISVAEGNLIWLPAGSTRSITAGADGLSYLTVHRRRPGLQIQPHSSNGQTGVDG